MKKVCWFCAREEGGQWFSLFFDTPFCLSCLFKNKNNPEAEFIFKEHGIDENSLVLVACHTENNRYYAMFRENEKFFWGEVDRGFDNVIYSERSYDVEFSERYLHKKMKEYLAVEAPVLLLEGCKLYRCVEKGKVYIRPLEMFNGFDDEGVKRFKKISLFS